MKKVLQWRRHNEKDTYNKKRSACNERDTTYNETRYIHAIDNGTTYNEKGTTYITWRQVWESPRREYRPDPPQPALLEPRGNPSKTHTTRQIHIFKMLVYVQVQVSFITRVVPMPPASISVDIYDGDIMQVPCARKLGPSLFAHLQNKKGHLRTLVLFAARVVFAVTNSIAGTDLRLLSFLFFGENMGNSSFSGTFKSPHTNAGSDQHDTRHITNLRCAAYTPAKRKKWKP